MTGCYGARMTETSHPTIGCRPTVEGVAADLRRRIKTGDFREIGDYDENEGKLPSAMKFAKFYGLSRQGIIRAIATLKQEGLLRSRRGAGVWVRKRQPLAFSPQREFQNKPPHADIFTTLLQTLERQGSARIDSVDVMLAEDPVRRLLGLKDGAYVAVRRRTNVVDDEPVHTDDSYVALDLVEGSDWLSPGNVERGTNKVLAELGHRLTFALDTLTPRLTQDDENKRLGLGKDSVSAIELISTAYDRHRNPVQVTIFVLPEGRNVTVYERSLEQP